MPSLLNKYGRQFEDWMVRMFYQYGLIVAKYPFWFLVGPLILTALSIPGFFMLKINLDLYKLFVPLDAPVRYEFERTQEFNKMSLGDLNTNRVRRELGHSFEDFEWERLRRDLEKFGDSIEHNGTRARRDVKSDPLKSQMMAKKAHKFALKADILRFYVVHRDFENLLESKYLGPLYDFTNKMMEQTIELNGKKYAFEDFCQREEWQKCQNDLNIWVKHADTLFKDGKIRSNPNLQLSYPVLYLFNKPKDIGNVIYGVDVEGEKNEIKGARVLTLHWFIRYPASPELNEAYIAYRDGLMNFWNDISSKSDFVFVPHNDKAMDDEMMKIISTTLPFAVPATLMLMFFVVFSNFSFIKSKSKPVEMYLGVWSVIFALLITFGFFFYFGVAFNPVTSTMPFLVLAIGVDDDFLMIAAWRELDRKLSVVQRMGLVMGDAGASITVTSFTNFFCFGLGYYMCSTPAVADFCLVTSFGVLIDYFMQLSFFAAVLVYSGRKEETGGLASPIGGCYDYLPCNKKNDDDITEAPPVAQPKPDETDDSSIDCQHHAISTSPLDNHIAEKEVPFMHKWFGDKFAVFIMRQDVKVISWLLFMVYTCVGLYGCTMLRVDISPVKYIRDNSPIQTFVALADKYIWADNVMPTFHVMNPPDFRIPGERAKFNELVFRLEHTNYSIGRVSTNFWIWEYQQYLNDFPQVNIDNDFYDKKLLRDFFNQLDYSQYRDKVKVRSNATNKEPCVLAFTFQTSFYGLNNWDKRQAELFHWRDILNSYPEYDMFLSGIFSPFLIDQRRTIAPSSMQTIGSALLMMAVISSFFLPDKQSVFLMTWSLLSISMGVCGGLAIMGSDLDSVSMGCIVMAIGLAVDYSVHICYRYHRSTCKTAEEKVKDTLRSVAWPITQAVFSTLFGLFVTCFVPAYLVRVFFQTVYLVNIIGLTHALIWLPQLIWALDPCERVPLRERSIKKKGN